LLGLSSKQTLPRELFEERLFRLKKKLGAKLFRRFGDDISEQLPRNVELSAEDSNGEEFRSVKVSFPFEHLSLSMGHEMVRFDASMCFLFLLLNGTIFEVSICDNFDVLWLLPVI